MVVDGPGGTRGFFERGYEATTRTVELTYAFREDLPAWIPAPVPLVPGKGAPIVLYATLRIMKMLGIALGEARAFRLVSIHEVLSVAHLAWLVKRYPGAALRDLARQTHSFQYAETCVVQSGHRVIAVHVDTVRAERRPVGDLCFHYEQVAADPAGRRAEHDAILRQFGLGRADEVLFGYDLILQVVA